MSTADETGRDLFSSLDQAFARRVQAGLDKRFEKKAPKISWDDWQALKPSLAAYKRDAEDIRGYLNKGGAVRLRDISKRSRALMVAIRRASNAGLEKPIIAVLDPVGLSVLEDLLCKLEEDFSLEGDIAPEIDDMARTNLFSNFEAWWMRSTNISPKIVEGSVGDTWPTPFMFAANEVFNLSGLSQPIGASFKSLKDLRRADRRRFEKFDKLAETLKTRGLLE